MQATLRAIRQARIRGSVAGTTWPPKTKSSLRNMKNAAANESSAKAKKMRKVKGDVRCDVISSPLWSYDYTLSRLVFSIQFIPKGSGFMPRYYLISGFRQQRTEGKVGDAGGRRGERQGTQCPARIDTKIFLQWGQMCFTGWGSGLMGGDVAAMRGRHFHGEGAGCGVAPGFSPCPPEQKTSEDRGEPERDG